MKKLYVWGIVILNVIGMVSCYPNETIGIHEKDIALTYCSEEVCSGEYKTFVMPDSVVFIKTNRDTIVIEKEAESQIRNLVKQNFTDRHFQLLTTEEAQNQIPDFMVTITVFTTSTFHYSDWGSYWNWYAGWRLFGGGEFGNHFYPYYEENGAYYVYDSGLLVIDMLDVKRIDYPSGQIPVLWSGINSGILAGDRICFCEHLVKAINQCFIQSPNLEATE